MTQGATGERPFSLWSLTFSVYLPTIFFSIGEGMIIPVTPLFAVSLGASVAFASIIVALRNFGQLAFDIPAGQAAAYYPEVNPLVPLESIGDGSHTPTSKFIAIKLERARDDGRIL